MGLVQVPMTLGIGVSVTAGAGSPEGIVTAGIGSLYLQTDGAGGNILWGKISGTGSAGWSLLFNMAPGDLTTIINNQTTILNELGELSEAAARRLEYFIRINGTNNADNIIITEMTGYTRQGGPLDTAARWRAELSSRSTVVFSDADDRRSILLKPGAVNDAANTVHAHFMVNPLGGTEGVRQFVDFRETYGNFTGTALDTFGFKTPSWSISALMRKESSGDTTHARVGVGFDDIAVVFPSRRNARIGIHGDGASGFRFGSINCPDGLTGGADNASTDIDANSVQPAELVSPGANWFKFKIKMVPPTPAQTGRWGAYFNDVLVGTFTLQANFPRGNQGVNNDHYRLIQPGFWAYPDPVQIPGILLHDLRVTIEDNWTL